VIGGFLEFSWVDCLVKVMGLMMRIFIIKDFFNIFCMSLCLLFIFSD
jgi:hypothetical protein